LLEDVTEMGVVDSRGVIFEDHSLKKQGVVDSRGVIFEDHTLKKQCKCIS
jgi:hypothetical protein